MACVLFLCLAVPATPQSPAKAPEFEVASVKPCAANTPVGRRGDGRESSPDRVHLPCQTLRSLISWSYLMFADGRFNPWPTGSISGGPSWIDSDPFEIDAKAETPQSWVTINGPMLRSLLEQRFHLKIRKETKEVPVYAITVAKGSPKLQSSSGDCITDDPEHPAIPDPGKPLPALCGISRLTRKGWEAFGVTMEQFATLLSTIAGRKVVDRTGISGVFDIRLDLNADDFTRSDDQGQIDIRVEQFAEIRSEVQRLGLRIDSARAPVDELVVDAAEKPSEN